ncbi:hypothetical protein Tco_0883089, partial [Tanacetum coccineum]
KRECHRRFGPIVQGNKLGELCKLRQTSMVEEYQRKFEQLVTRAGILTAEQQVEIFVSRLQEYIGVEVELHRTTDLTRAMSLAWLYEKRGGSREVTNNMCKSSTHVASGSSSNKKLFNSLSHSKMEEHRAKRLCFNHNEKNTRGHECHHLFWINGVGEENSEEHTESGYT